MKSFPTFKCLKVALVSAVYNIMMKKKNITLAWRYEVYFQVLKIMFVNKCSYIIYIAHTELWHLMWGMPYVPYSAICIKVHSPVSAGLCIGHISPYIHSDTVELQTPVTAACVAVCLFVHWLALQQGKKQDKRLSKSKLKNAHESVLKEVEKRQRMKTICHTN